jgi:hypothetical protein
MMIKRVGVLTGGGDAPGQNVCLKAIVQHANDRGIDVIGIRQGWLGLLRYDPDNTETHGKQILILNKTRVRDIDRQPGSFLHSSRVNPAAVAPQAVPYFLESYLKGNEPVDLTPHIKRAVEKIGIEALVVLGDSATLNYAARGRLGMPVIGSQDGEQYGERQRLCSRLFDGVGTRRALRARDQGDGRLTRRDRGDRDSRPRVRPDDVIDLIAGRNRSDSDSRSSSRS